MPARKAHKADAATRALRLKLDAADLRLRIARRERDDADARAQLLLWALTALWERSQVLASDVLERNKRLID